MFGAQTRKSDGRPNSKDGTKGNIWDSMLAEAARGKELPEKQLLILGGTPEQQRELLEVLSPEQTSNQYQRDRQRRRKVPVSNLYALGYTYQDVLDADQDDVLARLSVYMLAEPSPAFAPLLNPLLTTKTIPNTLIVILLNWSDPHKWPRQLRQWMRLLRSVLITLDEDTKIAMEENMTEWKERRKGVEPITSNQANGAAVIPPLGPGEWDEGLGLPLCVVCQNSEKMDNLEKEQGWQEEDFDFVLQVMRTVLLKHGSSMVYTSTFDANSAQNLIHSSLGIHSMLKRETIKHNVIDRDKVLVPPNWDSHGKIRIQREGFDPERISTLWSIEIQDPPEELVPLKTSPAEPSSKDAALGEQEETVVQVYESTLSTSSKASTYNIPTSTTRPSDIVHSIDMQTFLSQQLEKLEELKRKDAQGSDAQTASSKFIGSDYQSHLLEESGKQMAESIGPVQVNMGGVNIDAAEHLRRINAKETDSPRTPIKSPVQTASTPAGTSEPTTKSVLMQTPDDKEKNRELASFFASLMKNKGTSSPRTPAPGGGGGG